MMNKTDFCACGYRSPRVERFDVTVEKGFAFSVDGDMGDLGDYDYGEMMLTDEFEII